MMQNRNDFQTSGSDRARHGTGNGHPLPLVAITGTRGKSTTAWLLYRMLRERRVSCALWCSSGVYVNGQQMQGELLPWSAAVQALAAGELEFAVQELEAPVVASVGLPEATYGFAAITTLCGNDEACLLAPESRHASRAHEIVARAVHPHGVLVLNADDQAVLELADRATSRIVLFALHPENPALRRARAQGLPALWYQDGLIVADQALLTLASRLPRPLRYETDSAAASPQGNGTDFFGTPPNESREYPIIDVREAPCTLGGALLFQIQNIMCASALALSLGIPATTVAAVIRTFLPDTRALPGSCNVLSLRGHAVLVDGARYPWTLRSLVRGIRHRNPRKTFVLTHSFPWLNEEELREVGRLLGRLNGLIVFAEPIDEKRYRAFQDGVVQNPYPPVLAAQSDLEQALRYALSLAQPGDLCLVLAADPSRTIELLERIL